MTHNHISDRDISEIKRPRSDSSSSFRLVEIEVVRFFETFWTMLKVFERCFPRVSFWEHEFRVSKVCVEYLCFVTKDEINVKPLNFSSKNSLHLSSKCNLWSNSKTFNWSKFRNHLKTNFAFRVHLFLVTIFPSHYSTDWFYIDHQIRDLLWKPVITTQCQIKW